ncbi:hypothetical protein BDV37DRAFT_100174 [Aspergillus pseudonomiae]|uniref:Uncharacterized protein n=1 Tax=Aspergillus pseudonomiae TaxID=1506151 RepID=A0A5N7CS98_9EURO|nr:uncharacterized protein BDV37DRAFT_100174 [Aspergillus pseudonomiae]KAE8396799.1 hypothetical protein BDV37DRAFT_100174 [Aspergillus pseudonomiae]
MNFKDDCHIPIERPENFFMLGSASNPILIDIEEKRVKTPSPFLNDTDGDTILEIPSYRSQGHIFHDQENDKQMHHSETGIVPVASDGHKGHSMTIHEAVHEAVAGGFPLSGETVAQPSGQENCAPAVASHTMVADSWLRNAYSGT